MANGVNKIIIIGNCGQDPEIKYSASGAAVCNFSVAVNESYKKDGEKHEHIEWINIVTFGKLAEICGEYLTKGKQVYLEGKIQTQKWEDKEGNTRYTTKVVAHQMQMLGSRSDEGPKAQAAASTSDAPDFEDIPF